MLTDPTESRKSWDEQIYDIEVGSIIGQRLGVSYLQSNKEYVVLIVNGHQMKLYQTSMGILAISGVVWDAGFCLADFLVANQTYADGMILDVGCGTGVCGIAALLLGSSSVTFTDAFQPPSLDDNLSQLCAQFRSRANFIPFDWSAEVVCSQLIGPSAALISSLNLDGTDPLSWDTVLCSDLLYDQKAHEPLIRTLKQIRFKKAIFAYKRRHDTPERFFFRSLSTFCTINVVMPDTFPLCNLPISAISGLFIIIATPT